MGGMELEALLVLMAPAGAWLAVHFAVPALIMAFCRTVRRAVTWVVAPVRPNRWYARPIRVVARAVVRGNERLLGALAGVCRRAHPVPVGVLVLVLVIGTAVT
jgi:hypothetical protein